MDFALTEDHRLVQKIARDFAEKEVAPHIQENDEKAFFDRKVLDRMGELGLLGICVPEKYGGMGFDYISLALARLGSAPEKALMIGDHPIDITTGRNARTLTCGVLTGRSQKDDFIAAGADMVLANAAEILKLVTSG